MSKSILVLLLSLASLPVAKASSLYVNASGQFSTTDTANVLVTPGGAFTFRLTIDTVSAPVAGSVTALGFDEPFYSILYTLNGAPISVSPTELRFNTLLNGGLFDLILGSGLTAAEFSFQGPQAFTGPTTAPAFAASNFVVISFTYSDPVNYDTPSTPASASITTTPEPSSLFLIACSGFAFVAAPLRRFIRTR